MRKMLAFMGATLALSVAAAQAQSVCTSVDAEDENGDPICVTTCCVDLAPPDDPTAVDPTAGLCGALVVPDVAVAAGAINPNGEPPSDPADPTTQSIVEGCISVAGAVSTADFVGEGSCEEQAVAACVAGDCSTENTAEGPCPDDGNGGGGGDLPIPLPDPGELPGGEVPLPL